MRTLALAACLAFVAGCGAPAATPVRQAVTVTSTSQAFALDGGDYDLHVSKSPGGGCIFLLSLNGGSPNLEIPDANGDTAVIDDGAGSGYHIGPDPREAGCAAKWTVILTPK